MNTRKRDGRSFWLRVSRWLRVSAWLPPGLAIAWLATLATLIRNTGIMIAVWAATVSLVLLVVLVTQLAADARRRASTAEASAAKKVTANPASTGKSSTDAVSAEAGSTASGSAGRGSAVTAAAGTEVAVGQPAAPSAQHDAASTVDPVAGTARPSVATAPAPAATAPAPAVTAPVPAATAPVPAATTYPPLAAGPIVPDLLVLSAEEVASALRVELNLVIDSIDAGALPGNHLGDYWLIDQRALTRWLRGRYVDPPGRDQLRRSQASHRAPTAAPSSLSAV